MWLEFTMTSPGELWPPFNLTLTTPRLVLRAIRDDDIPAAVRAAMSGIHPPGNAPFTHSWAAPPSDEYPAKTAQLIWRIRAETSMDKWSLQLGVWEDGNFIGCQDLNATNFVHLRTVTTGSWLQRSSQGQGFGKEMRAAVLVYAFDWLNAEVAESEAAVQSAASIGVSKSLGYEANGVFRQTWIPNERTEVQHLRLTPETFKRPDWELTVAGNDATAKYLGIRAAAPH